MKESGADGAQTQETSPPSTSSASSSGQDGERQGIAPKGATRPPTELPRSHSKEAKTTRSAAWKQEKEKEKEEEEEEAEDEDNSNFAEIEDKIHLFTLRILEAKLQPYKEWRFVGLKQRHKAYCQVWVGDEVHAKTAVAKNSLHPKWNSTFYFQLRSSELDSQDIGVLLWNKEAFLKDSLVGTVKLSVQHLLWKMQSLPEGEELVEWYPLSRRSDKFPKVGDIHLAISHESRLVVDFIATLSDELAQYIFSFLDAKTLCIIAGVSRQWKRLADDGRMWKHYFKKHKWNTGVAVVANGKTWKTSYATHRGTYATIGEAINAANPSTAAQSNSGGSSSNNYSSSSSNSNNKEELELMDTLILAKGVYEESITINKPLRIVGDGNCEDVVIRAKSRSALSFRTEKGKVQNIKIEQVGTGKHSAIHINQGALVVKDCDISSDGLACIAVSNKATPIIRRNRIHDSTNIGVLVLDYGAGLYEDNDIFVHSHACVEVRNHSEPKFINNIIRDGNSTGVMAVNNGKGLFEGNDIRNNNRAGIKIKSGANPIFKLNEIHKGKQRGVCVHKDGLGYFESNNIHSNGRSGFNIRDGANPVLKRNQIHDGLSAGVLIHDGGKGLLKANSIYRNLLSAVEIRQGGDPILIKNRIYSGKSDGIYVHSSGKGSLENNDIFQNARAGVRIKSGAHPILRRNRIYDGFAQGVDINTGGGHLEGNEIYGNALYGVQIRGGGSGEAGAGAEGNSGRNSTVMLQNKIYNNKHNGALISGKGSILMERNDIYSNLVIGIEVLQDAAPVVRGNRVIGGQNQKIGFSLAMNTSGLLEDNSIYENLVCGLEISTAGNPIVRRNQIFNGKGTGVRILENGCALLEENEIFGNESCNVKIESSYLGEDDERVTLIRNRVYNGLSSGVDIKNGSNAVLEENDIFSNKKTNVKIRDQGTNPVLKRNSIHNGQASGIIIWPTAKGLLEENLIYGNARIEMEIKNGAEPILKNNTVKMYNETQRTQQRRLADTLTSPLRTFASPLQTTRKEWKERSKLRSASLTRLRRMPSAPGALNILRHSGSSTNNREHQPQHSPEQEEMSVHINPILFPKSADYKGTGYGTSPTRTANNNYQTKLKDADSSDSSDDSSDEEEEVLYVNPIVQIKKQLNEKDGY